MDAETITTHKPKKKRRHASYKRSHGHKISHKFCLMCGCKNMDKLSVDHIIPIDKGGCRQSIRNIMFLCKICNSHKSNMMPYEWLEHPKNNTIKNYSEERFLILMDAISNAVLFHETHWKVYNLKKN